MLFTIYLCQPDGVSTTFEMHDAQSDEQALALAELILEQHTTAAFANVWLGDQQVGRVNRPGGASSAFDRR